MAEAPAEPTPTPKETWGIQLAAGIQAMDTRIETLFRPAAGIEVKRIQQFLPTVFTQLELMSDMPHYLIRNEDGGIRWEEFCHFLRCRVVWMGSEVYLCLQRKGFASHPWVLCISTPRSDTMIRGYPLSVRVHAPDPATAASVCDFLLRLVTATSEQRHVRVAAECHGTESLPVSGRALSRFLEQSRLNNLQSLTLSHILLNEEQWHALASVSRIDVDLNLEYCSLSDDTGCRDAFLECLQNDRGPTKLDRCQIDSGVLAAAFTGNSRVTSLRLPSNRTEDGAGVGLLFRALRNNRGLVDLNLYGSFSSDENWSVLCESLKPHPTLISLDLRDTSRKNATLPPLPHVVPEGRVPADEQKTGRTRAVAEMMKVNTLLQTIRLDENDRDEQVYTESILPYLGTNRYSPRVLAIKKADIPLRRPLLGLALQTESVRNDSNLLWMFLSGNPDVVL
jgi:hypothetical protein